MIAFYASETRFDSVANFLLRLWSRLLKLVLFLIILLK